MKIVLSIILWIPIPLFGQQIWVSLDQKGIDYQSAILSKVVLDSFAEDSISFWLNNKINFQIICNVDTFGYIHQIKKINCRKAPYIIHYKDYLEKKIVEKHYRVPICYESVSGIDPIGTVVSSIRENIEGTKDSCYYENAIIMWPLEKMFFANKWSIDTLKMLTEKDLQLFNNSYNN